MTAQGGGSQGGAWSTAPSAAPATTHTPSQQAFTASPIERLSDAPARFRAALAARPDTEASYVLVAGRELVVQAASKGAPAPQRCDLQALLLRANDPELTLRAAGDGLAVDWAPGHGLPTVSLPAYLLGQDRASRRWALALDISGARDTFLVFLRDGCGLAVAARDLRTLLPGLSPDALALAGHAAALSSWHQTHTFCPRCGAATEPSEGGARRRCGGPGAHKLYPRTDPVVIALVESPDGNRVLLGRSAKSPPGMYTCLSGFIDQCEGIEEAVRREVMEEVRVAVSRVTVLGTQPWPVGRYGSCELMIGCVATAQSYEVLLNSSEMEDVQWFDRDELAAAVASYDGAAGPAEAQRASLAALGFYVPPPFTIAFGLLRSWAAGEGGGCGKGGAGGGGGGADPHQQAPVARALL